ncbi:hypothetical protein EPN96_01085, partial [bacterium]
MRQGIMSSIKNFILTLALAVAFLLSPYKCNATDVSGVISSNATWTKANSPYIVKGNVSVYKSGSLVTLTIEPGVEVRFVSGTGLTFGSTSASYYGRLIADGTPEEPIIFTSASINPAPGEWGPITFNNLYQSNPLHGSSIKNAGISYGNQSGYWGSINVQNNALLNLENVTVENAIADGMSIHDGGKATVTNCTFSQNAADGIEVITPSTLTVSGSRFLNNGGAGLDMQAGAVVTGCEFSGNGASAISMAAGKLGTGSAFSNNTFTAPGDFVRLYAVTGEHISQNEYWANPGIPYKVTVPVAVYGSSGAVPPVLTLEPGLEMRFEVNTGITVGLSSSSYYGALKAEGEATKPIVFTSSNPAPSAGTWSGLAFNRDPSGANSTIRNAQIKYAVDGIKTSNSDLSINYSDIVFCSGYGVNNTTPAKPIDATNNWWGDSSGPYHATTNISGTGCKVTNEVLYNPWLGGTSIAPLKPSGVSLTPGDGILTLAWSANPDTGVEGHNVYRSLTSGGDYVKVGNLLVEQNFADTDVVNGTTYYYVVTAQNSQGMESVYSNEVSDHPRTDLTPPSTPVAAALPQYTNQPSITISGSKDAGSSILANGVVVVPLDAETTWSFVKTLSPGQNQLVLTSADFDGNTSAPLSATVVLDSAAPGLVSSAPASGALLGDAVSAVSLVFSDSGSGIDESGTIASAAVVATPAGTAVPGDWSSTGEGQVAFTPASPLMDGGYGVSLTSFDNAGNQKAAYLQFIVDTLPPSVPALAATPAITNNINLTLSGSKDPQSSIWINGVQKVALNSSATWNVSYVLATGVNAFIVEAMDAAGNVSESVTVTILFDNTAPPQVEFSANGAGSGTEAVLSWSAYDEQLHGDILRYDIYSQTQSFTSIEGQSPVKSVAAGTKQATVSGLSRGGTYFFAVVAVDQSLNLNPAVIPVQVSLSDVKPAEDVTNLAVTSLDGALLYRWSSSANADGDLAGYRVVFNGTTTDIGALDTEFAPVGLEQAKAYDFNISTVDNDGNHSSGRSLQGVTLLQNPMTVSAEPFSGYANVTWSAVSPASLVKKYNVYLSDADITTLSGLTPRLGTTATNAKITGLTNNRTYYIAVTVVNDSNGERRDTFPKTSVTPVPDTAGPSITSVKLNGNNLTGGETVSAPGTFTVAATDPSGVSRVEFVVDGQVRATDTGSPYSFPWNVVNETDGNHNVQFIVHDTLGNSTPSATYALNVALSVPPPPTLNAAATPTNHKTISITGTADKYSTVSIYIGGQQKVTGVAVASSGGFSANADLTEGANQISASASNRAGESSMSNGINVLLDTSLPYPPSNLTAEAKEGGTIRLAWSEPSETAIKGYRIYASNAAFSSVSQATLINTSLVTSKTYNALRNDGRWYFRVATVDNALNESELSNEAYAVADSIMPSAAIEYFFQPGKHDVASGRTTVGPVNVKVAASEELLTTPFLSITPSGGLPISIELRKTGELVYEGYFNISGTTPSGVATAVFSARDAAGNRGTNLTGGATITIDTSGPAVTALGLSPQSPIKNEESNPASVHVTMVLDEPAAAGSPVMKYSLSGNPQAQTQIGLDETAALNKREWEGSFILPANAGIAGPESLTFSFSATDDLGNAGDKIGSQNSFQIYQGELPPLDAPSGLAGKSLPGGVAHITWNSVSGAADYVVYRKGPDSAGGFIEIARTSGELVHNDHPSSEGQYFYTVSSLRNANGQESISGQSQAVSVYSDATPPAAPQNLLLVLVGAGVSASWEAVAEEPVSYNVYRTEDQGQFLTPILSAVKTPSAIDTAPSPAQHMYAVTAVDTAGNESAFSPGVRINFQLLPVAALAVRQVDNALPVLSWSHTTNGLNYDVYVEPNLSNPVNGAPLTQAYYEDTGYAGNERIYIVKADDGFEESLGRGVTLPELVINRSMDSTIKRGVMNRLDYEITNNGVTDLSGLRVKILLGAVSHVSSPVEIGAGQTAVVPVVVGGYEDLPDLADLTTTVEIIPETGEKTEIVRNEQIAVGNGKPVITLTNDEPVRGGAVSVSFTIENPGKEEFEIVTASGTTSEIWVELLDADGNVLSAKPYIQKLGANVISIASGTVARIPGGGSFISAPLDLPVPTGAPDSLTLRLRVENLHYHSGGFDHVQIDGVTTTRQITLVDTSYYGTVTQVTPQSSNGGQDITITGKAFARSDNQPLANVPLTVIVTVKGFERKYGVYSDENGDFSQIFKPLPDESGVYSVCAVHPDLFDRPSQASFTIGNLSINPATITLKTPRNFEQKIPITVIAGEGTTASNLRIVYDAADQTGGTLPAGVSIEPVNSLASLLPNQKSVLEFKFWGDNTAAASGVAVLKVVSDEEVWGKVTINYHLTAAAPVLSFMPNYVDTGVRQGEVITETVTLENKGYASFVNVSLSLVDAEGNVAPGWMLLNAQKNPVELAVGEKIEVPITFAPPSSLFEGVYSYKLRVSSSNAPQVDINLFITVTQSGNGNALFKVEDIYTGTTDESNNVVQGVGGAKIYLQNELAYLQTFTVNTDATGEALFTAIPAGQYKYRASAPDHEEVVGRIWVKPGVTANEKVFLKNNLITVEWSVVPTLIEDEYEIVLHTTFQTNVPAAVVTFNPTYIGLPEMKKGDVYQGELEITNQGLINAKNAVFTKPDGKAYYSFELLTGIPSVIAAKTTIHVPFKVVALIDFVSTGGGGGGGCSGAPRSSGDLDYDYECANGGTSSGSSSVGVGSGNIGSCGDSPGWGGGGGGGGGMLWGDDSSKGGSTSSSPSAGAISEELCELPPPQSDSCDRAGSPGSGDRGSPCNPRSDGNDTAGRCITTGSGIDMGSRKYYDRTTDLKVKVPGGFVEFTRRASGFDILSNKIMDFSWTCGSTGGGYQGFLYPSARASSSVGAVGSSSSSTNINMEVNCDINLRGEKYRYNSANTIATGENGVIYRLSESRGYRWEDKKGNWVMYYPDGWMKSFGYNYVVLGNIEYIHPDFYSKKRPVRIKDANDNVLIDIFYYDDDNNYIVRAADYTGREVLYTYTLNGLGKPDRLETVTDVLGNVTRYEYPENEPGTIRTTGPGDYSVTVKQSPNYVSVSHAGGQTDSTLYKAENGKMRVEHQTASGAKKISYLDLAGRMLSQDVNGKRVKTIARSGRTSVIADEKGNESTEEFDEWGRLIKKTYLDGTIREWEYLPDMDILTREKINGVDKVVYEYDDSGYMLKKTEAPATADERIITHEYQFGTNGVILSKTERLQGKGYETAAVISREEYDATGNMTSRTDADGKIWQYQDFDVMGNARTTICPRGNVRRYTFDAAGRKTSFADPYADPAADPFATPVPLHVTRYEYDPQGNMTAEVRSENVEGSGLVERRTSYTYNSLGKLLSITSPAGAVTTIQYDTAGRPVKTIDPLGRISTTSFDSEGRLLFSADPAENVTGYYYDERPEVAATSDNYTEVTYPTYSVSREYDAMQRVVREIAHLDAGNSQEKSYAYDSGGRIASVTDEEGNVTEYVYDSLGRIYEEKNALGGT